MWFIGVEVEQETSAPPPKKSPRSAPALQHNKELIMFFLMVLSMCNLQKRLIRAAF